MPVNTNTSSVFLNLEQTQNRARRIEPALSIPFLNFCHAQPVRPPSDLLRLTKPAKPCLNPAKSSNYLGTVRFCFRNKTRICAPEKGLHANISSKPVKKKMPSEELIHSINNQLT